MIIRERTGILALGVAVVVAAVAAYFLGDRSKSNRIRVPWDHPHVERDLAIVKRDTLRILVLEDPLSWEARPKAVSGLEYELLERFAKGADLVVKTIVVTDPDSMFMDLQNGAGDVIATQYVPRSEQQGWVACTRPYHSVRPMVARLREDPVATSQAEMELTSSMAISRWSPFLEEFRNKGKRAASTFAERHGTPEEVLMDVLIGRETAAVVTDAVAGYEAERFPNVEFTSLDAPARPLCFAVRTNAPELLGALDRWLSDEKEVAFRDAAIASYQGRPLKNGALRKRAMPARADSISPYDEEFRVNGGGFGWKWQLLAAMAWKESRFDSSAVSNKGAQGIMQFMPRTATHYGLDSSLAVADHIHAAKRYIARLDTVWMRAVPDREQRLRFVLASYNAGVGHIIDAQRLAERLGLDPKQWEHNVERAVLLLSKPRYFTRPEMKNGYCKGSQVFHYVRDIVSLYDQLTGLRSKPTPKEAKVSDPGSTKPVE